MAFPVVVTSQGTRSNADSIARRALASVKAYRSLFATDRVPEFESVPIIDKQRLVSGRALHELVGDDGNAAFSIIASSGSSGTPCFWPQLRSSAATLVPAFRGYLEAGFEIHRHRTLAVVGLALGSWIGGDYFSWALKNVALASSYPFTVISPGNRHDELLQILSGAGDLVDQILLVVCPSAIGHLQLLADSRGISIPLAKLRYLVIGEPFPEALRVQLASRSGHPCPMLSVYGSADTGLLGAESAATAALRALIAGSPSLAAALSLSGPAPHLFHNVAPDAYIESVNQELVVTRWQGVPLVRYNLHDRCTLLSWRGVQSAVRSDGIGDPRLRDIVLNAPEELPDLIAISGRSDRCLMLCGTNISEAMLDEACASLTDGAVLTGAYQVSIVHDDRGRQRLALALENRAGVIVTPEQDRVIYARLVEALARVQPEFGDDWRNIYRRWDEHPEHRILKLTYLPWPAISEREKSVIKAKGIVS